MKKGHTKVELVNGAFKMELMKGVRIPTFTVHTSAWHPFTLDELKAIAAEIAETVDAFKT